MTTATEGCCRGLPTRFCSGFRTLLFLFCEFPAVCCVYVELCVLQCVCGPARLGFDSQLESGQPVCLSPFGGHWPCISSSSACLGKMELGKIPPTDRAGHGHVYNKFQGRLKLELFKHIQTNRWREHNMMGPNLCLFCLQSNDRSHVCHGCQKADVFWETGARTLLGLRNIIISGMKLADQCWREAVQHLGIALSEIRSSLFGCSTAFLDLA